MDKKSEEVRRNKGSRVAVGVNGRKMKRGDIEALGLKEGDKVLCIDPDSEMRRNEEKEMMWTVIESTIIRIAMNGIRTEKTAHDFLRDDGIWSHSDDEEE